MELIQTTEPRRDEYWDLAECLAQHSACYTCSLPWSSPTLWGRDAIVLSVLQRVQLRHTEVEVKGIPQKHQDLNQEPSDPRVRSPQQPPRRWVTQEHAL